MWDYPEAWARPGLQFGIIPRPGLQFIQYRTIPRPISSVLKEACHGGIGLVLSFSVRGLGFFIVSLEGVCSKGMSEGYVRRVR